jgi:peptidoglycan/xylan/chitin deacetylase (PgdA/CDA1 family)
MNLSMVMPCEVSEGDVTGRLPRGAADTALRWTPLQAIMRRRRRGLLAVVAYHAIHDADVFEDHLDVLEEMGTFVSLEDVASNVADQRPLPSSPILLTFDDGHPSVLHTAAPRMHARGIPAVVFLITDLIGSDHVIWTTEVEDLVASGGRTSVEPTADGRALVRMLKRFPDHVRLHAIDELRDTASIGPPRAPQLDHAGIARLGQLGIAIASHTKSHPCLPHCSDEVIEREVTGSRDALADLLGQPPIAFAYPNGDHDARSRGAVSRAGYALAFVFDHRLSPIPPNDPYAISRLRINEQASGNRIRTIVSGLHPALHHLRGRS